MFVSKDYCKDNIATMNTANWYKSEQSINQSYQQKVNSLRFVHMRFELPFSSKSYRGIASYYEDNNYVIPVNIDSKFAIPFFGQSFIDRYHQFVNQLQSEYGSWGNIVVFKSLKINVSYCKPQFLNMYNNDKPMIWNIID